MIAGAGGELEGSVAGPALIVGTAAGTSFTATGGGGTGDGALVSTLKFGGTSEGATVDSDPEIPVRSGAVTASVRSSELCSVGGGLNCLIMAIGVCEEPFLLASSVVPEIPDDERDCLPMAGVFVWAAAAVPPGRLAVVSPGDCEPVSGLAGAAVTDGARNTRSESLAI